MAKSGEAADVLLVRSMFYVFSISREGKWAAKFVGEFYAFKPHALSSLWASFRRGRWRGFRLEMPPLSFAESFAENLLFGFCWLGRRYRGNAETEQNRAWFAIFVNRDDVQSVVLFVGDG